MNAPKAANPDLTLNDDGALFESATSLGNRLAQAGLRVATAESCTGGWIAKTFTDVDGSSVWYNGGVVSYSNDVKHRLLSVSQQSITQHGAVSEEVVRQMARGALVAGDVDCAVSVSGVAGPGGGTIDKPVGTVWIAAVLSSQESCAQRSADQDSSADESKDTIAALHWQIKRFQFDGSREAVRRASVAAAIHLLNQVLDHH